MFDFSLPPEFALDTETNGLEWLIHRPFGFSFYCDEFPGRYVDVRKFPTAKAWLQRQMDNATTIYAHHAKFDMHMLREMGLRVPAEKFVCTMVRAALIDEHLLHYDLDSLGRKYVGLGKLEMSKSEMATMEHLPSSKVAPYAIRDSEITWKLAKWQEVQLQAQDLLVVDALELRMLEINWLAEHRGICVDLDAAHASIPALEMQLNDYMAKVRDTVGMDININSPTQVRAAFGCEKDELNVWRTRTGYRVPSTDGGSPSFTKDTLLAMPDPLGPLIVRAREVARLSGTFVKQHVLGHAHRHPDGTYRVHPNINQTRGETGFGTVTGRMSYNDPAMQQIPARNKVAAAIMRPMFIPMPGQEWCYGDLEQHEFRVFAHYSRNPTLEQVYRDNPDADFHNMVAEITELPRNATRSGEANAKQVNLGLVFNMGAGKLAQQMGLPYTEESFRDRSGKIVNYLKAGRETMEILNRYHARIPGVKKIAEQCEGIAANRGFVRSITKRRIRFPDKNFTYKASGLVYQSTSADLNKMNVVTCHDVLKGSDSCYLMNVHDEYSLSLAPGDDDRVREIKNQIQGRGLLRIPIRIDFSAGKNWWHAKVEGRAI